MLISTYEHLTKLYCVGRIQIVLCGAYTNCIVWGVYMMYCVGRIHDDCVGRIHDVWGVYMYCLGRIHVLCGAYT